MITRIQLRRVQQTGGSTFVVSLPKEWVERVGIKKLDEVLLVPQPDMSIVILPKRGAGDAAVIDVKASDGADNVLRNYISLYIAGFDVVKLKFQQPSPDLVQRIKDQIRRWLIGVEVVEESSLEMVTQVLPTQASLPLKKALERMGRIASGMQREAMEALSKVDVGLAEEVARRDDEVDRFYHFIARQLNIALSNPVLLYSSGLSFRNDCLGYMLVAKSIERSADHAVSVSRVVGQLRHKRPRIPRQLYESGMSSNRLFEDAMKALLTLNTKLAEEVITEVDGVVKDIDGVNLLLARYGRDPAITSYLRIAVENIKRIAEYCADISEVVVNLSAAKPGMALPHASLEHS